ncbi:MAG: DNA-processing protein DprA [Patescibacteria group bacterium]
MLSKILKFSDKSYPSLLKEILDPPKELFVKGELLPNEFYFSVVGPRKPSSYGIEAAKYFARDLAEAGFTLVSGLALGIDTVVHQQALACGKRTIAVLGSGLNIVSPSTNERLAKQIETQGALISELPLDYPPLPENFPRRNRIISGLSYGVLVIEASERSGTLITARLALEQSREVFAVPGEIFSVNSQGTNKLIQQGAKLVSSVGDILEEFSHLLELQKGILNRNINQDLGEMEKKIVRLLSEPKLIEEILQQAEVGSEELSSCLTILELKSIVKRRLDGKYQLNKS